jgi:hypothetical protein
MRATTRPPTRNQVETDAQARFGKLLDALPNP